MLLHIMIKYINDFCSYEDNKEWDRSPKSLVAQKIFQEAQYLNIGKIWRR